MAKNDLRPQTPVNPDNWLYKDFEENRREFSKFIYLGKEDTQWGECTNEEKETYEREHEPERTQCTQAEREEWEDEHKPEHEPEIEKETEE